MRHIGEKIILVFCIVVFGIVAMNLVEIGKEYYDGQKEYEELKEYTEEKVNGQQDDPTESEAEEKTIDFAELRKINEDIVAWIQISGIGVDYPVVQGEDNEYYLHHTFRKEANKAGSIFLDYRNRADFTEQRVLIYGHNMKDGSMFSDLKRYQDNTFRKESGTAYLYLPEKTLQLEIVACERVSMRDEEEREEGEEIHNAIEFIEFSNTAFKYLKSDEILKNVNLKLEKGNIYGFIGGSGCGKSTIIKLLLGLYILNLLM